MSDELGSGAAELFAGPGEVRALARGLDWSATPLGAPATWPSALRSAVLWIFDTPVPVCLWSGPEYALVYNDAYRRILSAKHPAALGQPGSVAWAEIWEELQPQFDQVRAGGAPMYFEDAPFVMARLEGGGTENAWFSYSLSALRDEDGEVCAILNISPETTDRVLADAALKRSETAAREDGQRIQLALAAGAIVGTWFWDLPSDSFTIDAAFARSFGLDPALGSTGIPLEQIIATVHPDDRDGLIAAINAVIARGGPYAHQYRVRRADGRYYWIEANGRVDLDDDGAPRSFPGVLIDIDERRAVEAERDRALSMLRALNDQLEQRVEQRTRELQDSMDFARLALSAVGGVGVWTYETATDCFTCDANVAKLYDIDPVQGAKGIKRADFLANVHEDDKAELRATMAGGLVNPGDLELEYRIVHRDGSIHWVLSRGHTYFDENGAPVRRTGVGVDMTKPRLVEEQLRQSQKMEAVGQLTGGIAHDFNNLLQGIIGSLEIMDRRIAQGRLTDIDRFIAGATTAANRAAALTHRLLAFSRRQPLDPRPVRPNALLSSMEDLLRRTIGETIELEMVLSGGLWATRCDPNQLENAVLNLVINARDAMPDGGKLIIETGNAHLDHTYTAQQKGVLPGQYVCICVTDTGTGMNADTVSKAFEPFFTTKPIGQGTGLGLSMIYGFAQQSEGHASIYSELGQGTTFRLYLPRYLGETEETEAVASAVELRASDSGDVVLVVEDDAVVRGLIVYELQELGYTTLEAIDGPKGLEFLRSRRRIDLLVTDIGLPGLNGRQLADAGRALRPGLKVMFMTGYAENAALASGFLEPGMEMITKPFAMDGFASRVREMLEDKVR